MLKEPDILTIFEKLSLPLLGDAHILALPHSQGSAFLVLFKYPFAYVNSYNLLKVYAKWKK